MSDLPPGLEERIARDERFQAIRLQIDLETELRQSKVVEIILEALAADANEALDQLSTEPPGNMATICQLQARISHARLVKRVLHDILENGRHAETSLRDEDQE